MDDRIAYIIIYFFYGLAFFSMGLLVTLEGGRASDPRLRKALQPLAFFGLIHAVNEWLEMFELIYPSPNSFGQFLYSGGRLIILSFSFVSLAAFGAYLLAKDEKSQRIMLVIPVFLEGIWVFGLFILRGHFSGDALWQVVDVWTRYSLALPASLLAATGLIVQQRAFRQAGMVTFGRDALWAAVAFGWYGLIGQSFTGASPLPPSNVINQDLFLKLFGFPVQLFRALSAGAASFFIIRFMNAFQFETEHKIAALQEARIEESRQREELRAELFRRIVAAQEAERTRIARDLHDETGQALTAIGMGLRGLKAAVKKNDPEQATAVIKQLETLSGDSLNELQHIISDLHPSHLDDLGLPAAIRWYCGVVHDRTSLNIKTEIKGEEKQISVATKTAIFRIVQEALSNIIKHAKAGNIVVSLAFEAAEIRVRVKDDGRGFNPNEAKKRPGIRPALGLAGMEERAHLLGGSFFVASVPGQGTLIEVLIPYVQPEREQEYEDTSIVGR
jgi:signal transduction histidine kinase